MIRSISLLVLLAPIGGVAAQELSTPPLATGAAWEVKVPNGMTVQMTFNPDGSGQVNAGLFTNKVTWSLVDGAFCIGGTPDGDKCLALTVDGNTVVGTDADGKQMVFVPA